MYEALKPQTPARAPLKTWLKIVAFMVFCMILLGGATRLTDSGLSITEWQPIMGAIPPLSDADWAALFAKYRQTTEFKVQNSAMSLTDFKVIFWWEWAHRQLGRLIGVAFALPLLVFALMGKIKGSLWPKLLILLVLGAAQGALGWYMVSSGLVGRTDVSQYRLAAHLTLASFLFAAIIWVAMGISRKRGIPRSFDDWSALLLVGLVLLQIAAGGFVAGLDAGMGYTTWPKMDGAWIPKGLDAMQPLWRNAFENALTVQFNHRLLAYITFAVAIIHAWRSFSLTGMVLAYLVFSQAILGILTLMFGVPLVLGLLHQAMAMLVLMTAVWNLHTRLSANSGPALQPVNPELAPN
jgi:heme a synthase